MTFRHAGPGDDSCLSLFAVEPELPNEVVADIGHVHLKVSDLERGIGFIATSSSCNSGASMRGRPSSRLAGITITSASTPGAVEAVLLQLRRRPASTISRFATRAGATSPRRSSACSTPASRSIHPPIAAGKPTIYLRDPDDNGLELTWDRPRDKRPNPLPADDRPLDLWISARCLHCSIRRPIAAKIRATIRCGAVSGATAGSCVPSAAARSS